VVRYRAAEALAKKQGNFVPQLASMLQSDNLDARYGACQALEYLRDRAAPATDELTKLLSHRDMWLQIRASYALAGIGTPARKAVPALLKLALSDRKGDPRDMTRRYLCLALFLSGYVDNAPRRGLLADSLDGVDRQLLYPAFKRMLTLDDGLARSQLASVYGKLSDEELDQLWPDILRAVEKPALSGEMFADGIRVAGLQLLAKHHVKEGMRVCIDYARNQNPWASENRMWEIMTALKAYGAAAKEVLPDLRELVTYCKNEKDFPDDCKKKKTEAVEDAIKAIEAAKDQPQLRSIAPLLPKQNR
jgi:HEAT repeat protein